MICWESQGSAIHVDVTVGCDVQSTVGSPRLHKAGGFNVHLIENLICSWQFNINSFLCFSLKSLLVGAMKARNTTLWVAQHYVLSCVHVTKVTGVRYLSSTKINNRKKNA